MLKLWQLKVKKAFKPALRQKEGQKLSENKKNTTEKCVNKIFNVHFKKYFITINKLSFSVFDQQSWN